MNFQIPKGLFDIVPYGADQKWKLTYFWSYIENEIRKICAVYGYKEMRTPIFERSELFIRSVGESSDIVKKEMYDFLDKAGRSMSLRPEGTSSAIRALIENKIFNISLPHKFFYIGPMFRYDRPQAGRYRQHHQFGVEAFGERNFQQDGEIIDLLWQFYQKVGLKDLTLYINSVGDEESRKKYKKALIDFLKPNFEQLSADSKDRFNSNPLRILDSKEKQDQDLLQKAPSILDFLSPESKDHFDNLCALLSDLSIPFSINDKLVRGLDYYTQTVFEVVYGNLGAQNSIGGGGRYDGLVKSFGGPDLSGIGFGTGIERIIQTLLSQNIEIKDSTNPFIYFIPLNDEAKKSCFYYTTTLRHLNIPSEMAFSPRKIQKEIKMANDLGVKFCAFIGEEELLSKKIILKDLEKREQFEIEFTKSIDFIKKLWTKN